MARKVSKTKDMTKNLFAIHPSILGVRAVLAKAMGAAVAMAQEHYLSHFLTGYVCNGYKWRGRVEQDSKRAVKTLGVDADARTTIQD